MCLNLILDDVPERKCQRKRKWADVDVPLKNNSVLPDELCQWKPLIQKHCMSQKKTAYSPCNANKNWLLLLLKDKSKYELVL